MQSSIGKLKKGRSTHRRPTSFGSYHSPYYSDNRSSNNTNRLEYRSPNDSIGPRSYGVNDEEKIIKPYGYDLGRDKSENKSRSTAYKSSSSGLKQDEPATRRIENNLQAKSQNSKEEKQSVKNLTRNTEFSIPHRESIRSQQSLGSIIDTSYRLPKYFDPAQHIAHDRKFDHSTPTLKNDSENPLVSSGLGVPEDTAFIGTHNKPTADQFVHSRSINLTQDPVYRTPMGYENYGAPSFDYSYRYGVPIGNALTVPQKSMNHHSVYRSNDVVSPVYYHIHPYIRSSLPSTLGFSATNSSSTDSSISSFVNFSPSLKTNDVNGDYCGAPLSQDTCFNSMYKLIKPTMLPTLKTKIMDVLSKDLKGHCTSALYLLFYHKDIKIDVQRGRHDVIVIFNIGDAKFSTSGSNKKCAKERCARKILNHLLQYESHILTTVELEDSIDRKISNLVFLTCDQIMKETLYVKKSKVLAGIVMVKDEDYKNGQVVAFSTGSKCFGENELYLDGSKIIDSHAEILVSRGFKIYLMDQLNLLMQEGKEDESIFNPVPVNAKYHLKENISFVLYVSGPPCGDCRLFTSSKGEVKYGKGNMRDKHPERQTRGVLRVKVQSGHGGVPVKKCKLQNSEDQPGKSGSLVTMSCSDKLLRMNLLGVQGALLSSLIAPIYYSTIVIGDSFDINGAKRALYGRIMDSLPELPSPYVLNKPVILKGTSKPSLDVSKDFKYPKTCVNWVIGYDAEYLECSNGMKKNHRKSQLCKYMMLKKFLTYIVEWKHPTWMDKEIFPSGRYVDFKQQDKDYKKVKELLFEIFVKLDMGEWCSRKPECESFSVELDVTHNHNI